MPNNSIYQLAKSAKTAVCMHWNLSVNETNLYLAISDFAYNYGVCARQKIRCFCIVNEQ